MQMSVRIRRHSACRRQACRDDGRIGQHWNVPAETGPETSLLLVLAFNTPLVSAAAGSVIGVVAERQGPIRVRWAAPARARVVCVLALTDGAFGLLETDSTALHETRRIQVIEALQELLVSCLQLLDSVLCSNIQVHDWVMHEVSSAIRCHSNIYSV